MLQTCTALVKKNGDFASLQKVQIRDSISLTENETSDPLVFSCEWALTTRTTHLGCYCASTANRTVEGLKVLWVILQERPSLDCTHEKVEAQASTGMSRGQDRTLSSCVGERRWDRFSGGLFLLIIIPPVLSVCSNLRLILWENCSKQNRGGAISSWMRNYWFINR